MPMTKEELIGQCRYYGHEKKDPVPPDYDMFVKIERAYVERDGDAGEYSEQDYALVNGKDFPEIPRNLLLILFLVWGKDAYDIGGSMPYFYELVEEYLSGGVRD